MARQSVKETLRLIKSDYQRCADHYGFTLTLTRIIGISILPTTIALGLYRISHFFWARGLGFIAWPLYSVNVMITGCDIVPRTQIGERCLLGHASGQMLSGKIGRNATFLARATVGSRSEWHDIGGGAGLPVIGDDVTIGASAHIQGPVNVGHRATIGALTLVIDDVGEDCTVVGVPARVISGPDMEPAQSTRAVSGSRFHVEPPSDSVVRDCSA